MAAPRPQPRLTPSITLHYTGIVIRSVTDFDIETGTQFRLVLENAPNVVFEDWFSNNDPVLYMTVAKDGQSASVEVRGDGECSVRIVSVGLTLNINVHPQRATSFSTSVVVEDIKS